MRRSAGDTVNTLNLKTKQVNSLDTLMHHHRDRGAVPLKELLQIHAKHRLKRRQITRIHSPLLLLLLLSVLLLLLMLLMLRRRLLDRRILL